MAKQNILKTKEPVPRARAKKEPKGPQKEKKKRHKATEMKQRTNKL